jgi:uroporphyrinogen III methyltransferase/synthase
VEGAEVVICPVIEIEPLPVGPDRLANLGEYGWLILTSANGVDRLFGLLGEGNLRFPTHIKVAAIGPETASRIRGYGVDPAVVPERYVAEDLADQLTPLIRPKTRVLLARAAGARDVLPERLEAAGARVEVLETYRAVAPAGLSAKLAESASSVDVVTFTSSSTVQNFVEAGGAKNLESTVVVACIGPITAQTAQELGLKVDIIASEYTARGLVDALVRYRAPVSA